MVATVNELFVGKIGSVYVVPYGTTAPFTIPPAGGVDYGALSLAAAWTNGELGYLHEEDTPEFGFETDSTRITAWQANGQTLRTLLNSKVRNVKWGIRAFNRRVWNLVEPGTTWVAGTNGSYAGSIPANGGNPAKAGLFEINDLDAGYKLYWYIPRMTVSEIGSMKATNADTFNASPTFEIEHVDSTSPPYYVVGNHPGLAA